MFRKHCMNLMVVALALVLTGAACTRPMSTPPAATPTNIPNVTPLPPVNPVDSLATQAAARTLTPGAPQIGGGTEVTPTFTPAPTSTPTPTVTPDVTATSTLPVLFTTPTVITTLAPIATIPTSTPGRPTTYTLQYGEWPYCIARRFNVNQYDLLTLNGLTEAQSYNLPVGTVLKIPQTGSFVGNRALLPHPTTYTVQSSDETFNSIACKYGDVEPGAIAIANGLPLNTVLRAGQTLRIP